MTVAQIRAFGTRPGPPFSVDTTTIIAPSCREYEGEH